MYVERPLKGKAALMMNCQRLPVPMDIYKSIVSIQPQRSYLKAQAFMSMTAGRVNRREILSNRMMWNMIGDCRRAKISG